MHEMGIALQIIDIVKASLPEDAKGAPIERINLKIGKLSAVVADSLRFCFEIAVKDTALDGAVLHIEKIPVTARCNDCRHQWTLANPVFSCPACDGGAIDVLSGRELAVDSIEIKDESNSDDG